MNNIIKQLENNDYSINDYNNIINFCNKKIIYIKNKEMNEIFLEKIKDIYIKNDELKCFFNMIKNSLKIGTNDYLNSIIISFDYNEFLFDLCIYSEEENYVFLDEKIHILDKNTHSYEVYYDECDKILLKKIDLKSVSIEEINELVKSLFETAAQIINLE